MSDLSTIDNLEALRSDMDGFGRQLVKIAMVQNIGEFHHNIVTVITSFDKLQERVFSILEILQQEEEVSQEQIQFLNDRLDMQTFCWEKERVKDISVESNFCSSNSLISVMSLISQKTAVAAKPSLPFSH